MKKEIFIFVLLIVQFSIADAEPLSISSAEFIGSEPAGQYGWRTLLADVDGDGVDEVIVSARMASPNGIRAAGSVFVYTPVGDLIASLNGIQQDELFGEWVLAKDLDNDGRVELIVGAAGYSSVNREGAVYIFSYINGQWAQKNRLVGEFDRSCFGRIISFSSDLDGDGIDDLLIGAPCNPVHDILSMGSIYILSGKKVLEGRSLHEAMLRRLDTDVQWDPSVQAYQPSDAFYFGSCLDGLGDIDGDGTPDFIVSAATATDRRLDPSRTDQRGVAFVFSGKKILENASLHDAVLFKVAGAVPKEWLGNVVMRMGDTDGKGDIDGDGVPDFLVGAPGSDASVPGAVYLYSGAKAAAAGEILNPNNPALIARIDGEAGGDRFGYSVADIGYADQDTIQDFAVGAYLAGNVGKVYLYSGATRALIGTFEGKTSGEGAGAFVAGRARRNNRLFFMAGAWRANINTGKAYFLSIESPLLDPSSPTSPATQDPGVTDPSPSSDDAGTNPELPMDVSSSISSGVATSPGGGGGCSRNTLAESKPGEILATLILFGLPILFSIFHKRRML